MIRIERRHPRRRSPCPLRPPHCRHAVHSGYGHTAAIAEAVFLGAGAVELGCTLLTGQNPGSAFPPAQELLKALS
ncbi:hypothetical protein [Streptomyces scabiei]|uniref:hypothetical protein n=1 Tax=Streptomyces scabiei TaxID=1930 RepID=UPI001901D9A9|nr:hypothetical protein [Streptomyces scabiei]